MLDSKLLESSIKARQSLMQRIRQKQGHEGERGPVLEENKAWLSDIAQHEEGPRPVLSKHPSDLLNRFLERCESLGTNTRTISHETEAVPIVSAYLQEHQLPRHGVVWQCWEHLAWNDHGIQVSNRRAIGEDAIGITGAFCALAETGTLMLLSGVDTPSAHSLVPETHIAIIRSDSIVAGMEDGFQRLHATYGTTMPRAVNFVSGPSRTADIEQKLVMGAHGPCRVLVVLIVQENTIGNI